MFKYLATATVGALVLAVALKARHAGSGAGGAPEALTITNQQPEVKVVAVPGGKDLTVRHRLLGAISRASLVYDDAKGEPRTVAQRTDCQQSLARASRAGPGDRGDAPRHGPDGRGPRAARARGRDRHPHRAGGHELKPLVARGW